MQPANPFQHTIQVVASDIDEMSHVNNAVYVRWIQEVAAAHWNHLAPDPMKLKYLWVVLRHEIDYKSAAFLGDEITGFTWVGEHHGARFDRFVKQLTGKKILIEAKTTWCLLNGNSLRPTRIPEEILALL